MVLLVDFGILVYSLGCYFGFLFRLVKMDRRARSILVNNVELDFGNCIPRLSIGDIHSWLSETCGMKKEEHFGSMPMFQASTQVLRVKFTTEVAFKAFLEKWSGNPQISVKTRNGDRKVGGRIFDAGEVATFVSIVDVPFEVEMNDVREVMEKFGKVGRIERRMYQGEGYLAGRQGWITASMILEKPIPSYLDIGCCRAVVKYDGQATTCKGCDGVGHWQKDCPNSVWAKRIKKGLRERRKGRGRRRQYERREMEEKEAGEREEKEKKERRKKEEEERIMNGERLERELERIEMEERRKRDERKERERSETEKARAAAENESQEEAERKRKEQEVGGSKDVLSK